MFARYCQPFIDFLQFCRMLFSNKFSFEVTEEFKQKIFRLLNVYWKEILPTIFNLAKTKFRSKYDRFYQSVSSLVIRNIPFFQFKCQYRYHGQKLKLDAIKYRVSVLMFNNSLNNEDRFKLIPTFCRYSFFKIFDCWLYWSVLPSATTRCYIQSILWFYT